MRRLVATGPALIVLLTAVLIAWLTPGVVGRAGYHATSARITLAQQTLDNASILDQLNAAYMSVAEAVGPSVVHLQVRGMGEGSTGSGWVFDDKGHIVTNAHVVAGSVRVRVEFDTGRQTEAEVIGVDPFTDIAVLKADPGAGLFPARRATGQIPQQGQMVFAFGSPFGFKFSMSKGVISGLGREPLSLASYGGYTNFIQTDAAVNPGNSGGPLTDHKGRVIGMTVAIATGRDTQGTIEGQSAGISFAIPLATIESVVPQLINTGEVRRGFLGIAMAQGASAVIEQADFRGSGVLVSSVEEGSPAASGGLRSADVIVKVNGQHTPTSAVLRAAISSIAPEEKINLRVFRQEKFLDISVVLAEFERDRLVGNELIQALVRTGLAFGQDPEGNLEIARARGFAASVLELREGMRVTAIDGKAVASIEEAHQALFNAGFLSAGRISIRVQTADENGSRAFRDLVLRTPPRNLPFNRR